MIKKLLLIFFTTILFSVPVTGAELVVGVKPAPPFVIEDADGDWRGITIELWERLADELDLEYRFVKRDLSGLINGAADEHLDVVAAALTITSEREKRMDFTHPFYSSGLGIAIPVKSGSWLATTQQFISLDFLKIVMSLLGIIFVFGFLVWVFERKRNTEQFGGGIFQGVGSGLWWSLVTMTTVGYGDKAPKSFGGRLIAMASMFTAIIMFSTFTAAITSSLTVGRLSSSINGPDDLYGLRVFSVLSSTSAAFLDERKIIFTPASTLNDCLAALAAGRADAVVYDVPLLRYYINEEWQGTLRVLPLTFERQNYGFGLPPGSQLREPLNRTLLTELSRERWRNLVGTYLGENY
jgi:polar amino acid transport system substrate-binding protein